MSYLSRERVLTQPSGSSSLCLSSSCLERVLDRILPKTSSLSAPTLPSTPLICNEVPDPIDIQWLNLEGDDTGSFFWRRIIIHTVLICLFLFLTTPRAILSLIQKTEYMTVLNLEWVNDFPSPWRELLKNYLPALLIVTLN